MRPNRSQPTSIPYARPTSIARLTLLTLASTCLAVAPTLDDGLPPLSPQSQQAVDRFTKGYKDSIVTREADLDAALVAAVEATPDPDVAFFRAINPNARDWPTLKAFKELRRLNTQRTLNAALLRLKSKNWGDRGNAVWLISAFNLPPCVPTLLDSLQHDPFSQVRADAARALSNYTDPAIEPALLAATQEKEPNVVSYAFESLAKIKSAAALPILIQRMNAIDDPQSRKPFLEDIGSYHTKQSTEVMLAEYNRLAGHTDGWNGRLRKDAYDSIFYGLPDVRPLTATLGPVPDDIPAEWNAYWKKLEPLLTDDMKLKPTALPQTWADSDFATDPKGLTLTATLDAKTFRVGEPIRLDLTLANTTDKPYRTVVPNLPSAWWGTMAFGIKLTHNGKAILDLAPSDMYEGSYSGAPQPVTLQPHDVFRSYVCLQYWLVNDVSTPLPEGDYDLSIAFDSNKYAMIRSTPPEILARWDAAPLHFSIKGDPIMDPQKLLDEIAAKSGQPNFKDDLASQTPDRGTPAWRFIYEFSDTRMTNLLRTLNNGSWLANQSLLVPRSYEHEIQPHRFLP
jgi:hypothetical protein